MVSVEIVKKLVTDSNEVFYEGSEIAFKYCDDYVICKIKKIHRKKGTISATDVLINKKSVEPRIFYLKDMKDISYVYYD